MATDKVGIKTRMTIKKETLDKEGKVTKREFFFPSLGQSAVAETMEEARKLAEVKAKAKK